MRSKVWPALSGLALVAACAANLEGAQASVAPEATEAVVVRVAAVVAPEAHRTLVVHGVTRAAQRATLSFPEPGRLVARPVAVGDAVEAGAVLARLDPAPLAHAVAAAEARVTELTARRAGRAADRSRLDTLELGRMVSAAELDRVVQDLAALDAALDAARTAVDEARRRADDAVLRAPYAGRVLAVGAEPGETVGAGHPVVQLSGDDGLEVEVQVPEAAWTALRPGLPAPVALPHVGRGAQGHIVQVASAAHPEGLFPVVVALEGSQGLAAGLTASVTLPLPLTADAEVPVAAIVDPIGGSPAVLRVVDGVAERVPVEPTELLAHAVAVRGALAAGDQVVVSGHARLLDGDRVEVVR